MKKALLLVLFTMVLLFVGCPSTWENACKIYLTQQEFARAKEQAIIGTKQVPPLYNAYCLLGKAEIGLGNWIPASQAFLKAYEIDANATIKWMRADKDNVSVYWQTFYNAALSMTIEKKYNEALSSLKFATLIDSSNVSQFILEGNICSEMGNKDGAVKAYTKALTIDPENAEAYYFIGNSHFEKKEFDSSLVYYGKAVKYFDKDYNKIKVVLFKNVQFDKALAAEMVNLWKQKKKDELDQFVKTKLGSDGGYAANEKNIERFVKVTDGLGRSYYFTGITQHYLKNDTLALRYLAMAIDLMPNDPDVLFFVGELLVRSGKWSDARAYYERLAAIKPDDFAAWFYIGVCYSQEKNYKKAIEIYEEKALPLEPRNVDLLTNIAFAYRESGNNKKALEYLQKVEQIQKETNFTGHGKQVVKNVPLKTGLATFDMSHNGSSNFAVELLDDKGQLVEMLVNEIGAFDGSKAIGVKTAGKYVLDITADGNWQIFIEQK